MSSLWYYKHYTPFNLLAKFKYTTPMKPVVLVILDGFGIPSSFEVYGESPFEKAKKPTIKEIERLFPFAALQASGVAVGLPPKEPGNSEVGHLTLGAGRTIFHHLPRIIVSINDGSFFENRAFLDAASHVKKTGGSLHIMGLFSSGSVHAYLDHLYSLMRFTNREKIPAMLHLWSDGRDAPPRELAELLPVLEAKMREENYSGITIASLMGRFYAMDRDGSWERIEQAYHCLTGREGESFTNPLTYAQESYNRDVEDEFLKPAWRVDNEGKPVGRIKNGDAVIIFNFGEDSFREIAHAFLDKTFNKFLREKLENLFFVTMTEYEKNLGAEIAFPPLDVNWPLSRVLSEAGKKQVHIAETEKYAHVTYFFNGGREAPFPKEDRVLIPSSQSRHFDQNPEMASREITEKVLEFLPRYDFLLVNFANADMVGHTGNFEATIKAIEILDLCLSKIMNRVLEEGGALVVTGDHGNAEEKYYRLTGRKRTKHTTNVVPFYLIANRFKRTRPRNDSEIIALYQKVEGVLADVAPTVLDLMELDIPAEMTGVLLLPQLL